MVEVNEDPTIRLTIDGKDYSIDPDDLTLEAVELLERECDAALEDLHRELGASYPAIQGDSESASRRSVAAGRRNPVLETVSFAFIACRQRDLLARGP
jgi:hypothetical protein